MTRRARGHAAHYSASPPEPDYENRVTLSYVICRRARQFLAATVPVWSAGPDFQRNLRECL